MERCPWCEGFDEYRRYHDEEWGVPLRDDRALFELLILEGAQAGLSWETILNKRETYRAAFDQWDADKIAAYDAGKVARLINGSFLKDVTIGDKTYVAIGFELTNTTP